MNFLKTLKSSFSWKKYFFEFFLGCVLSLAYGFYSHSTIQYYPWYTNGDQDANLVQGALLRNAGLSPEFFHHPSLGSYVLLGESLRVGKSLGWLKCSDFSCLSQVEDSLYEFARVVQFSKYVQIFIIIFLAWILYVFFRVFFGLSILVSLIFISCFLLNGMWIHSVQVRSEFASVFFVWIAAIFVLLWDRYHNIRRNTYRGIRVVLLLLAGMFTAWSVSSKIQAVQFLPVIICFLLLRFESKKKFFLQCRENSALNVVYFVLAYALTLLVIPILASAEGNYLSLIEYLFLPFNRSALSAHQYIGFKPRPSWIEKLTYFFTQVFHFYVLYGVFCAVFAWCFLTHQRNKNVFLSFSFLLFFGLLNYAIFFNSLRYYAWHYLVYVDVYLLLILAVFFRRRGDKVEFFPAFEASKRIILIGLLVVGIFNIRNNTIQYKDYNSSYRNIPQWFYQGVAFCEQCRDFWQKEFGDPEKFSEKAKEVDFKLRGRSHLP